MRSFRRYLVTTLALLGAALLAPAPARAQDATAPPSSLCPSAKSCSEAIRNTVAGVAAAPIMRALLSDGRGASTVGCYPATTLRITLAEATVRDSTGKGTIRVALVATPQDLTVLTLERRVTAGGKAVGCLGWLVFESTGRWGVYTGTRGDNFSYHRVFDVLPFVPPVVAPPPVSDSTRVDSTARSGPRTTGPR